jgi:hypothetical protein
MMISCGFMGYNQNPLRFRWVSAIFCGNFDNTWGYWCKIDVLWCTGSKSGIVTFWTAFMAKWYQANEILLVDCAVMLILYVYLIIYLYLYIYICLWKTDIKGTQHFHQCRVGGLAGCIGITIWNVRVNGLKISKISRPNTAIDSIGLCIAST